ncbi:MAG: GTP cyclohydrolase FolE2 [Candidatus Cloacimonetes bacterium]|nr:GTP cyclohydrolase FolE2 [Candidatus Cloacimonadota bacterium]
MNDIQSENDDRRIGIDKVGVRSVRYPIIVSDRASETQSTVATLDITVDLPHHHRGTHMSRFLEVLSRFHRETFIDKLPEFLAEVRRALDADRAFVHISFPYFIRKTAPVSGSKSLQVYDCWFDAALGDGYELRIGVDVPVTTLCPCSREISERGAHNQRSQVRVELCYERFIWLEEIIETVESCASCELWPLLKREDERWVTEHAYDNPRFVEDIVREVTLRLQADERIRSFVVESENMESIHSHNAYARKAWVRGPGGADD